METVILSKEEFDDMPEYSCTLPSGTTLGKVWKCDSLAVAPLEEKRRLALAHKSQHDWYMGGYVPDPNAKLDKDGQPDTVRIVWRKVEIES